MSELIPALPHQDALNETNLAGRLVESKVMSEFLFAHSTERVNLVAKNEEGNLGEFLDRKQRVELGL